MDFFETSAFTNHNITEVSSPVEQLLAEGRTKTTVRNATGRRWLITDHAYYLSMSCVCVCVCFCVFNFTARLSRGWLSRCSRLIKRIWIFCGCPWTTRSIWPPWRKRRDSAMVRLATRGKAAGVEGMLTSDAPVALICWGGGFGHLWHLWHAARRMTLKSPSAVYFCAVPNIYPFAAPFSPQLEVSAGRRPFKDT